MKAEDVSADSFGVSPYSDAQTVSWLCRSCRTSLASCETSLIYLPSLPTPILLAPLAYFGVGRRRVRAMRQVCLGQISIHRGGSIIPFVLGHTPKSRGMPAASIETTASIAAINRTIDYSRAQICESEWIAGTLAS